MTNESIQPASIIRCERCGKSEFAGNARYWNIVFESGTPTHFLCPECQTQAEFLEAEVNDALTDCSKAKVIGNIDDLLGMIRPHLQGALWVIEHGNAERGEQQLSKWVGRFRKLFNAMYRRYPDMQIENDGVALAVLQEFGELPSMAE